MALDIVLMGFIVSQILCNISFLNRMNWQDRIIKLLEEDIKRLEENK